jgi:hypothetical protein
MSRRPYIQEQADEDGWTRWIQPVRRDYRLACCDCGLVHSLDFRVRKGRAQFRVSRNNRATAAMRRRMKGARP